MERLVDQEMLKKAQDMMDNFNLNKNLLCDEECQHNEMSKTLYDKLQKAKENVKTAPEKYENAEEKYYKHKYGESEYTEYNRKKQLGVAKKLGDELTEKFNEKYDELKILLNTFNSQQIYDNHITDLLKSNKDNIFKKKEDINRMENSNNLSNRLSYYLENDSSPLNKWNKMFMIIYWLIFAAYLIIVIII